MNLSHRSISTAEVYDGNSHLESGALKPYVSDDSVLRSSARLVAAAERSPNFELAQAYYGEKGCEEEVFDVACPVDCGAIVTRNHYGCLVLNAKNAMFIDVDMHDPNSAGDEGRLGGRLNGRWGRTFDDLRNVLASVRGVGFRIYRTAAGFRILATGREFQPGFSSSSDLMRSVGADKHFVKLCRTQQNFRARLTPKPWRCGMPQPPGAFPRLSENERRAFSVWLSRYEQISRERATCQFLEEIRSDYSHDRVTRIVDFHDRTTKAFEHQLLA